MNYGHCGFVDEPGWSIGLRYIGGPLERRRKVDTQ